MAYGHTAQEGQGADTMRLFSRAMPGQCLVIVNGSAHVVNSSWVGSVNREGPWIDAIALEEGEAGNIIHVAMRHGTVYSLANALLPKEPRNTGQTIGAQCGVAPLSDALLPKADGLLWLGRDGFIKSEPEGKWAVMIGRMVDRHSFVFDPQPPTRRGVSSIKIERFVISGEGLTNGSISETCDVPFKQQITNVSADATFSEPPASMQLQIADEPPVAVNSFPHFLQQDFTVLDDTTPVTLTATSADGLSTSKTIFLNAMHRVFWCGSDNRPLLGDCQFALTPKVETQVTFNAPGHDEYAWFASPSHWGAPQFWDVTHILQGGFYHVQTVEFGGVQYGLYRSDHPKLGKFTMDIRWD